MSSSHEQSSFRIIYSRKNTRDIGYHENQVTAKIESQRSAARRTYRATESLSEMDQHFTFYVRSRLRYQGKISVILRDWITMQIGTPREVYAREQAHKYAEEIRAAMTPVQLKGRKA